MTCAGMRIAHIPHDYVPGERLRLEAYTRIAAIDSEADASAVHDELADRYGPPPEPVLNLLEVARLRAAVRRAGLTDITAAGNYIRFAPIELPDSRQVRVQRLYPKDGAETSGAYDARTGAEDCCHRRAAVAGY